MPDDEPIEDLHKAAMTAGAASARALEAVLRSREQQQQQASYATDSPRVGPAEANVEHLASAYDSADARAGRHDAMEAAGIPLEARQAAMTADKMNAFDPAGAAASGSHQQTQQRRPHRTPQRERSR